MNYKKDERIEVIRHAYSGLFQLASRMLFDKYVDFIDVYAEVSEQEQKSLYHEIIQHKETAMLEIRGCSRECNRECNRECSRE